MMPAAADNVNVNVSDQFPAGLRVLVVDDDRVCLTILNAMLKKCNYQVTKCSRAEVALSLLRDNKNGFDVVLSDVHMPDMDGFKLLVHIGLEMDLPVIMMSADDSKSVVMKGVTHGACDYLIKPVRMEAIGNIWQHVVRKKKNEWKDIEPKESLNDGERQQQKQPEDPDYSSSANEGHNCKNTKRRKDNDDEAEERDDTSSLKKARVVWSQELHQQFVTAVSRLGIEKAVPKKILDLMNVPGLTRENVASHLQKFRLYLKRLSGSQQLGGINTSLMGNPDAVGYGSISSLSELELQALAARGQLNQLPVQNIASLQAVALGRSGNPNSTISVPLADQRRNLFSFEVPKLRYEQNQHGHTSGQMNLLHGIPTTMEPKQLAGLQRSFSSINSQGLILMTGQNYNKASRQPIIPIASVSQTPSQLNFTANHRTELAGNSFPLRGNLGITSVMSTSTLQQEKNLETRIPGEGFVPKYGFSNNVNQSTMGLTFDPRQHTNNVQGRFNVHALGQKTTGIFSAGEGSSIHLADYPSRVKTENDNCGTYCQQFCPQEYSQDDLLNSFFIQQQQQQLQQQQGIVQPENDISSDWYSLDNLPV